MITGTDLLQISLARVNMDRTDLEAAGVIDRGEAGDKAWSNFGRDMDTFILKLPDWRRAALADAIQEQASRKLGILSLARGRDALVQPSA